MRNKYLEKVGAMYEVELPQTNLGALINANKIHLSEEEYKNFNKEYSNNFSGKNLLKNTTGGAGLGALAGGAIGAAVANVTGGGIGAAAKGGAALGALAGLFAGGNLTLEEAKEKALKKYFPELNEE